MNLRHVNRFQAFAWHLLASFGVAIASALLVFGVWYPGALASASGVNDIYILLLMVDVVLGPVITLIIFNPKKKELRRDLAIVVAVQLGALGYGLHAVFIARPVYEVFSVDRFELVFANDFTEEKLATAVNPDYRSLPLLGPKVIAARLPDDNKARTELLFRSIAGGDDLHQLPQYYLPYSAQKARASRTSQALEALKKFNRDQVETVDALVKKYAAKKIEAGYLPLSGKARDLTVIVDRRSGTVLELVDLRPWR
ncbi:MAG: TfpX/TfpZ family type IV pilin accessory protein [Gammaproteobacteria bacterium]